MRVAAAVLCALVVCVALSACSTHRADLESQVPPQGLPARSTGEITDMAMSLLESERGHLDVLSAEALAPLTSAAAIVYRRTGSSRAFSLDRQFANGLLESRVKRSGVSGFLSTSTGSAAEAQITAISGLALVDAYRATGENRYKNAALGAANDVTNPALGWISSSGDVGIRNGGANSGLSVAMTANAALLLERAGQLGNPGMLAKSRAAFHTVYASQAAVGRWYANVGGRSPMNLSEWASTLYDLLADGSKESLGIAGGGVPALDDAAFGRNGQLLRNDLTNGEPVGVAMSLRMLAASPEVSQTDEALGRLADLRRHDGTVSLARADDVTTQAYFALAFAQWSAGNSPST
jgi:hypothetical protein